MNTTTVVKKPTTRRKKNDLENENFSPPDTSVVSEVNSVVDVKQRVRRQKPVELNREALKQNLQLMVDMLDFNDGDFNERLVKHNIGICVKKLKEMVNMLNT